MFNPQRIFRKEALEKLSTPEQLDQMMQIVSPMDWLPLSALGGLTLLALGWSIWGRIPIYIEGKGLLNVPRQVLEIQSPVTGQLQTIQVEKGQCVKKGQIVATIDPADLKQRLKQEQERYTQLVAQTNDSQFVRRSLTELQIEEISKSRIQLQQQLKNLQLLTPQLQTNQTGTIALQQKILQQQLKDLQAYTPILQQTDLRAIALQHQSLSQRLQQVRKIAPIFQQRLISRQKLSATGALAKDEVLRAEQEYLNALGNISDLELQLNQLQNRRTEVKQRYLNNLSNINQVRNQLQQLKIQETTAQQDYLNHLKTINEIAKNLENLNIQQTRIKQENLDTNQNQINQLQQIKQQIAQLKQQITINSQVLSLQHGCILDLQVTTGQIVNPGTSLALMQLTPQKQEIMSVSYFAVKDGKRITPGMSAQTTPDTVERQRFGGIIGKVINVSAFPITQQAAAVTLGNKELASNLITSKDTAMIEVLIKLESDQNNLSGYRWSSFHENNLKVSAGTTTTVRVLIEELAPITFLLPMLR
ncbi:NHLP bacteriocin system secretion protein [Cronbergia sp. UHCC 0137]|uniref:NHLP bacteriocin system secretion protein n=1 Tax=Cronbergia sp. UHCC 0137 TaxID=3110239 RepID=UPI002B2005FE|nr:NHLP bacteriocin system secretion protein [Cronbergia sp. UHCC 0137]MEA5618753.1 NHLP bacteriocin system secretion protein [Cronbergia sp. UHCC 0137]